MSLDQDLSNCINKNLIQIQRKECCLLNVVYDKHIPAQVARSLHRSRTWASDWLKRYKEEGIEGLRDRRKSGRPPDISKETAYKIKTNYHQANKVGLQNRFTIS